MRALLFATALVAVPAGASQWRDGQPAMAGGAADRPGQPVTLSAPPHGPDPARIGDARFTAAYARAGRPRIVVFWNRDLTADVDGGREEVTRLSADHHDNGRGDARLDAELVTTTRTPDRGARTAAGDEASDFDMERGFGDALAGAGARLIDRTAILRTGALGADTANLQTIETRAILTKAEWTLEVVAMADGRWRITARDLASGRIVARTVSAGRVAPRAMPYVAGERGFVRATAPEPGPYARGQQIARDAMAALSR
jgi:hypothetical protein